MRHSVLCLYPSSLLLVTILTLSPRLTSVASLHVHQSTPYTEAKCVQQSTDGLLLSDLATLHCTQCAEMQARNM